MTTTKTPKWNSSAVQYYEDHWRGTIRLLRFQGKCVVCRSRTYGFDDGEDDPRGILGAHASAPFSAADHNMVGSDVPACFMCQDDEHRYNLGLTIAKRRWVPEP